MFHAHEIDRLGARFLGLGNMQIHLVAVEISIVRSAHTFVETEGPPWTNLGVMAHNTQLVKRRLAVEEDNVSVFQVSLHRIANLEVLGYKFPIRPL